MELKDAIALVTGGGEGVVAQVQSQSGRVYEDELARNTHI